MKFTDEIISVNAVDVENIPLAFGLYEGDAEAYEDSTLDIQGCQTENKAGYICTRRTGHKGLHVATMGRKDYVCARWK